MPCPCPRSGVLPTILVVPIDVHECWALDLHCVGPDHTAIGELVYSAKTYGTKAGDLAVAERLADCMAWWAIHLAQSVPASQMERADVVCAIPANPPKMPYNLPDILASKVGVGLGVPCNLGLLTKMHPTNEIKHVTDKEAKLGELGGVFRVNDDVHDKIVVVVDDVVLSGATLETVASALRAAGAKRVIALTASRATKGLAAP